MKKILLFASISLGVISCNKTQHIEELDLHYPANERFVESGTVSVTFDSVEVLRAVIVTEVISRTNIVQVGDTLSTLVTYRSARCSMYGGGSCEPTMNHELNVMTQTKWEWATPECETEFYDRQTKEHVSRTEMNAIIETEY